MLLLNSTSDLLRVVTDAAVTVDVHASFVDLLSGAVTPGRTNTAITTATTTTVVGSPAASTARNIKQVAVRNKHATNPVTVTIVHSDGTTTVEIMKALLLAGESMSFGEGAGWAVLDATGNLKSTATYQDPRLTVKELGANQSNSTTTPTEVTGLTVPAGIGTYRFSYYVRYQAAATTTGVRFSVNHDGTVTSFVYTVQWLDVSATAATAVPDQDNVLATGAVVAAFGARAKSTAGLGTTLSVDGANADMLMVIEGLMVVTVAGNLELWHGSEVAAASTVMAGSSLMLTKVN